MELFLCRHGETEWTLSGQHTSRTDLPLTEEGKQQAQLLRKRLGGIEFEKIFSSPKKRALETCEGMDAEEDGDLEEWDYGDFEGLTREQIYQKSALWELFVDGAPNGESPEQVGVRADRFLAKAREFKGNVAVFSHGHFLRVLAARFLGLEPEMSDIFLSSVASVSILGYDRGQPVVVLWNDTHFL